MKIQQFAATFHKKKKKKKRFLHFVKISHPSIRISQYSPGFGENDAELGKVSENSGEKPHFIVMLHD